MNTNYYRNRFSPALSLGAMLFILLVTTGCSAAEPLTLEITAKYHHDRKAYTQGLIYDDGFLYESTGQYGTSSLRKVEPETGKVLMQVDLPDKYFAEGIERIGDKIYLLTWQERTCFVFDKATFKVLGQFDYSGQGWGLTSDGTNLIMSDGTSTLRVIEPTTFKVVKRINVTDKNAKTKRVVPVENLNELEFINGEIWANVWQSTDIARIDPATGQVLGWINCAGMVPEECRTVRAVENGSVLNGIAYDAEKRRVFLTGKNWPVMYELKIVEKKVK